MASDAGPTGWKKVLDYRDIRFWLVLLFVMRLYAIYLPPLEHQHPWRQTDGLMIARNFFERDANILYPRVDIAGDKTGITGSEFPLLNYLIYLVSTLFGYQHWYGRLIVLIVSTLGSYFFYRTIRMYYSESVAFSSTILLTASYWFSYSRKIFPDCLSAALCLMALYLALTYLEKGKPHHILLYMALGALGGLSKISSLLLLSVLIIPMCARHFPLERKGWVAATSGGILICVGWWYLIWMPYLNTFGYGNHFTTGCPLFNMGWEEIRANFTAILRRLYFLPMKYLGFVAFAASLIYVLYKKQWIVFALFIIPYACFLIVLLKTGKSIVIDQYYILTVIPVMAFISGFGLGQIPIKWVMWLVVFAIAVENIGDQVYDFRVHKMFAPYADLESIVDRFSDRQDLFVINSAPHNPTPMYFAHRRGWTVSPAEIQNPSFLADLKSKNCKFVLVCKEIYHENFDVRLDLPQLYESEHFRIYALGDYKK